MRTLFLSSVVAASGLVACDEGRPTAPAPAAVRGAQAIGGADAQKLVGEGAWLVDVRTPDEFNELHIDQAKNIPLSALQGALASLPKDKPIVVYCAVGGRSAQAAKLLAAAGFDVRNLGAMENWKK